MNYFLVMAISVTHNYNKIIKPIVFVLLLTTFLACPSDENCYDLTYSERVNDLIQLTPVQDTYNQDDVVVFKVTIPANNMYFGEEKNIFLETNDHSALLATNSRLFADNTLTFIKGSQGEHNNWFNLPYNAETESYELEVDVTLNRIGDYSIMTDDSIVIKEDNECVRYFIDTNIAWTTFGLVTFTVTE